jgi:hypothetical protein
MCLAAVLPQGIGGKAGGMGGKAGGVGGGSNWHVVNYCDNIGGVVGTCTVGTCTTSTCTLTVAAIKAGDLVFTALVSGVVSNTISTDVISGESFSNCAAGFQVSLAGTGSNDCRYVLAAAGGGTSVTMTPTTTGGGGNVYAIVEVGPVVGHVPSVDGSPVSTTNASCSSCVTATFTPSANDVVFQVIGSSQTPTAISGAYLNPDGVTGSIMGIGANLTAAQAPTWTVSPSGGAVMSTIGFK